MSVCLCVCVAHSKHFLPNHKHKTPPNNSVFHSSASFPCAPPSPHTSVPRCAAGGAKGGGAKGGGGGGCGVRGVAVLTDRMTRLLAVDEARRRLRFQAGAKVADVAAAARARGWAPPVGAPTTYSGLTLGGVLSTNAHGSAFNGSSTLVRARETAHCCRRRCFCPPRRLCTRPKLHWDSHNCIMSTHKHTHANAHTCSRPTSPRSSRGSPPMAA